MKAVGLHPDVFVVTSRFWQTTCTLVRSGERGVLHRLAGAAGRARAAAGGRGAGRASASSAAWPRTPTGTTCSAATRSADAPLGAGGVERRAAAQRAGRGAARAARLRRGALRRAPGAADAAGPQALPVPGHCAIGERELELHPDRRAHASTAWRSGSRGRRCSSCGDYLSPVEIPWISESGSASAYLATLARLEPLVEQAEHVVPGHGAVLDAERALAILREDRAYLTALLERGADAKLPLTRRTGARRRSTPRTWSESPRDPAAARRDLRVGEAERRDAVRVELGVALAVALEGGAGAVVAPAVELDGELAVRPVGVDLVAVDLGVRERARDGVVVAEGERARPRSRCGCAGSRRRGGARCRCAPGRAGADGEH